MSDKKKRKGFTFKSDPPEEVIRYFEQKTLKPSFNWRDVWGEEHAIGFTVAKATQLDILKDIRDAALKANREGQPFAAFQKELTPLLQQKGWWGKAQAVDPKTGKVVEVQLGSPRRLKTIYWANTRTARSAGLWEKAQKTKRGLPYFIYSLGPSEQHREHHEAKRGVILPVDDEFWDEWFPPNGWGCKCWLRQITESEATRRGGVSARPDVARRSYTNTRTGAVIELPEGIDPGWHTNPGRARAKRLLDHLGDKLVDAGERAPAVAKNHIKSLWRSDYPKALLALSSKERVHIPLAFAPDIQKKLGANTPLVAVSNTTVQRKISKHADVYPESFELVQQVLEKGYELNMSSDGNNLNYWLKIDDKVWRAAISKSRKGFLYLSTFFRTRQEEFEKARKKYQ